MPGTSAGHSNTAVETPEPSAHGQACNQMAHLAGSAQARPRSFRGQASETIGVDCGSNG